MTDRVIKTPSAEHPITVAPNPSRVIVKVAGTVIADTARALTLREAGYGPVQYIPRGDVRMDLLKRSDTSTYCPYKGEASYFSIPLGAEKSVDAVWSYETPYPAVADIEDHVAFYPARVDDIAEH